MSDDPSDIVLAVACFSAAGLILVALVFWLRDEFDRWLDRRLVSAWDAETDTPLYEQTVKALRYRPGAS